MIYDKICHWLAYHMPARLRYWATIDAGAKASTGEYSWQVVPEMLFMDVLKRIKR